MKRLVIAPLKKELISLISVLNRSVENEHGYFYNDTQFVVGGMGSKKFLKSILKYKELFSPDEVIVVGSCGSLKNLKVLDVVEVTSVIERDPETQKILSSSIFSENRLFPSIPSVVCVSGDGNVLDKNSKEKLLSDCDAEIVTWETASFFKAMKELDIPFTELRVVTDLADEDGMDSFQKNLSLGMQKLGGLFK